MATVKTRQTEIAPAVRMLTIEEAMACIDDPVEPDNFLLRFLERIKGLPPEEFEGWPTDLSKNVDHYLYGAPKIEE